MFVGELALEGGTYGVEHEVAEAGVGTLGGKSQPPTDPFEWNRPMDHSLAIHWSTHMPFQVQVPLREFGWDILGNIGMYSSLASWRVKRLDVASDGHTLVQAQ